MDNNDPGQTPAAPDSGNEPAAQPAEQPAVEPTQTPDPQPAENTPAAPVAPEPTEPAPATNDPTLPDHGIDPDKGIDPDAGDAPTTPEPNPADPNAEANPDLKTMTRAERAEYFRNIDTNTRKQVETAIDQAYQPQPVDELTQKYMDEGYDNFQAQILAREEVRDQQAQISAARAEIAELNAGLATDAMEVISTIDWLNPAKGEGVYDKDSAAAASTLYEKLCVVKDPNTEQLDAQGQPIPGTGQIVEARMSPSQFYHLMDNIRSAGSESSRMAALKAAESQMAAVAPPTSNTNRRETPFDNLSTKEKRAALQAKGILIT
jgi:hypothetical protein